MTSDDDDDRDDRDDRDDDDRDGLMCEECIAYGDVQCSAHGHSAIRAMQREDAPRLRLLRAAGRHGVVLGDDEAEERARALWGQMPDLLALGRPGRFANGMPRYGESPGAAEDDIPF